MQRSKIRILVSISTVVLVLIVFHYIGWLAPVERLFKRVINNGAESLYQVSIEQQDAYTQLETEVDRLALLIDVLEEENETLRNQLVFFSSSTYAHVGARIIGRNVDPVANTIILNKGTVHGVAVGNPVIAHDGILVGKIATADEETSIVRLLQDGQSRVAATIRNEEKTIGLIEGGYGLSVQMNTIPQNQVVDIGDKVMTSGLEEEVPRGLYIGKVSEVQKEAYQPFQEAIVVPAVDSRTLSVVSIITHDNTDIDPS